MRALGMGGRLSVLIAVLMVSYYLGRPLYWEMQSRLQQGFVAFDEPSSISTLAKQELSSRSGDYGELVFPGSSNADIAAHGSDQTSTLVGNVSFNGKDAPRDEQHVENAPANGTIVEKPGMASGESEEEQNPTDDSLNRHRPQLPPKESSRQLHKDLKRAIWDVPPAGSVMPPLEEFALRKEMVEFRAKKNVIVVTFANHAFMGFVRSWVKSLTDNNVTNLLVGAMDTRLLKALYWAGIPTFDMGSNMKTFDVGWGTPTFHKMGREKVILVNAFLSLEYELLMCDTDVVWLRNPLLYMERYPEADVLTSSDEVVNSVDDEQLERWRQSFGAYNIGINHWRPTLVAKRFAAEWMEQLLSDDGIWDQNGFNDLMRKTAGRDVYNSSGLFYCYDGMLKLGILPVSIFCSGHTFFVQALYKELGLQPYAVHTTFQFAGTEGKRHRLREAKVFYDPPDYYDESGGYLSYTPSLPENLLRGGAHTVESHFNLVNHQLLQVRNALAIASTLNRTLVMPELWCRFDRMWFGHPGILLGTHTKQPFLCPMDHIFEINIWLRHLAEESFGPAIRFREYSFLDNPRLPSKVKESTLKVSLCELGTPGCNGQPAKAPVPGVVQLPMNSTEDQLKAVLSPYAEAEVIEFSSMLGAFGDFSDEARATHFSNRVKLYTGIWCCVLDLKIGHIWYDIYWDKKPAWKPRPPATPEDDHQPW